MAGTGEPGTGEVPQGAVGSGEFTRRQSSSPLSSLGKAAEGAGEPSQPPASPEEFTRRASVDLEEFARRKDQGELPSLGKAAEEHDSATGEKTAQDPRNAIVEIGTMTPPIQKLDLDKDNIQPVLDGFVAKGVLRRKTGVEPSSSPAAPTNSSGSTSGGSK